MGTVYAKGKFLYIGFKDAAGKWVYRASGCLVGDELGAKKVLRQVEDEVKRLGLRATAPSTVAAYFEGWIEGRRARGLTSARDDEQRLRSHVMPALGKLKLMEVRPRDVRALFAVFGTQRAPRTVMNTYGALHRLFEDAIRDELLDRNPCTLEVRSGELPGRVDKVRTWRGQAVYTRAEVEQLISSEQLTDWARVFWGLLFLSGVRLGELAALRWENIDAEAQPLQKLHVHSSYTRKNAKVKSTKAEVPREVPVHPELAAILAEWKLSGWPRLFGRAPKPGDLVLPNRAGKHFNDLNSADRARFDLKLLGLRHRRAHDARRTFISLTRGDGGARDLVKWITHGPEKTNMQDQYTTPEWAALCETVKALKVGRRGLTTGVLPVTIRAAANGGEDERNDVCPRRDSNPHEKEKTEETKRFLGSGAAISLRGRPPVLALRSKVVSELAAAAERVQAGESTHAQVVSILATLRGGR